MKSIDFRINEEALLTPKVFPSFEILSSFLKIFKDPERKNICELKKAQNTLLSKRYWKN